MSLGFLITAQACLAGIADVLRPGGLLVLTSPFTWLEDYTARSRWLGGTVSEAGTEARCADALKAAVAGLGFEILEEGRVRLFPTLLPRVAAADALCD